MKTKHVKRISDIINEQGLKLAYETKHGIYRHHNKLFIAGTKDFPTDHTDDLKLPFDTTLNKTNRGRDADAYCRSHHEIDTYCYRAFFGWSSGFKFRKQYNK